MASALLVGGISLAQDIANDTDGEFENTLKEVVVTAIRYSMVQAIEIKRNYMEISQAAIVQPGVQPRGQPEIQLLA